MFKDIFAPKKGKVVAIGIVFLMLLTVLNVYVAQLATTQKTTAAPAPTAILSLSPASAQLVKDQIFSVNIILDPGKESVDAVDAILSYDPSLLRVQDVTPSSLFSAYPIRSYDNGSIQLSGFALPENESPVPVTNKGTFGTITFKAISVTQKTSVSFEKNSIVASRGQNMLRSTVGSNYIVR